MTALLPAEAIPAFTGMAAGDFAGLRPPNGEEIHIWLVQVPAVDDFLLTEQERERAARFRQPADAHRFMTGRGMLRKLISAYLRIPVSSVDIALDSNGKPFLTGTAPVPLHFNLSHSGSQVLIAFGTGPVGIDTEWIDRGFGWKELMAEHFTDAEQQVIAEATDPTQAFYRLWTRKEALVKAEGSGLGVPLSEFSVLADAPPAGHTHNARRLLSFVTAPGYASAVAGPALVRHFVFYRSV